jgi:RimJ/RimL family protein N-acetyltransferase
MATEPVIETIYPRPILGDRVTRLPSSRVPARSTLTGQYVEVVPLDASVHANDMHVASHATEESRHIWDYLPEGPWPDLDAYTSALRAQSAQMDRIYYAIRPVGDDKVCGQASYLDINPGTGVIEIGYIWFGERLQRTTAATEALYLMIRHAMGDLGYRRMQWRCNAENANSRSAAKRLGFRFEGIFFNHMIYKGKNRDTVWYSILDDEWPELREIYDAWLSPDNFDAGGVAKTSLSERVGSRGPGKRSV